MHHKATNGFELRRWVFLVAIACAVAVFGCQQVNYTGGSSTAAAAASKARSPGKRVPEEVLSSFGLETHWTQEAISGQFRNAYLVGDDLFAVEVQSAGKGLKSYFLSCFNRSDGLRRWQWDLKAPVKHAPFVYHYPPSATRRDDEVYLVQRDSVYCLDFKHGTTLWKVDLPFSISSGAAANETHYFVGSFDSKVFGIPKRKEVDDWFWFTIGGEVQQSPAPDGDFVYVTATNGHIYRFDASSGMRADGAWQQTTGAPIQGGALAFSRFVYAGSSDYKFYCLREIDGSPEWEFQAQAPIPDTPVAVKYRPNLSIVFCIAEDRRPSVNKRTLWALDAERGELQWKFGHVERVVAVGKKRVYVVSDARGRRGKKIIALDGSTGQKEFDIDVGGVEFILSSLSPQDPVEDQRGLFYLVNKNGLIQAVSEKL